MDITNIVWLTSITLAALANLLIRTLNLSAHDIRIWGFATISMLSVSAFSTAFLVDNAYDWLMFVTILFWLVSSLRLIFLRGDLNEIKKNTTMEGIFFFSLVFIVLSIESVLETAGLAEYDLSVVPRILYLAILGFSISVLLKTISSLHNFSYRSSKKHYEDEELPTVTLAIPARNETHALTESLNAAVASDYPKLEIIVLDDCSQDSTPELIKKFAHDGVRFVQGQEPSGGWLGKNHAYRVLLEEASGEYVIFSGVDIYYSPQSIRHLIEYTLSEKLSMLSVLPQRNHLDVKASFVQPTRYFWQLSIPKFIRRNQPVLSSCWVAKRSEIENLGGLDMVKNQIIPEQYFANTLALSKNYKFVISSHILGIYTRKLASSQIDTALRNLYPQLGKSPFIVYLAIVSSTYLFLVPFVSLFALPFVDINPDIVIMMSAIVLLIFSHVILTTAINPYAWFVAVINFPIAMLGELSLMFWSMWSYEYGEIEWKGRNVCMPVMSYSKKKRHK